MASFLDNPNIQYTPYIETNPTDAYLRVGMYKEQQLAAGIQRVQQFIDTLTGLPIIKPEDKQYVQEKLSSLKTGITKNLSGDFSDSRIVNQIAGAAKSIYSDPVVQNSVQGTMAVQKVRADVEQAKKDGKWNAANEYVVENGINSWLSDRTVGSKSSQYFSGYTPYTDEMELFGKYWKDTHPGEDIPKDAFYYDEKGNRQISKVLFKGKTGAQVEAVWNLVMQNPNVQQQMDIYGKYNFRGQEPGQIYQQLGEQTKASIDRNNAAILTLQAKALTGDKEAASKVEYLKSYNTNAEKSLATYAEALQTNPDAVKASIVASRKLDSLIGAYTYETMEESPLWKMTLEEDRFLLQAEQWRKTFDQNERKFDFDKYKFSVEENTRKLKEVRDTNGNLIFVPKPAEEADVKDESTARADIETTQQAYTQSVRKLLANTWSDTNIPPPYVFNPTSQQYEANVGPEGYDSPEAANQQAQIKYKALRDEDVAGNVSPDSKLAQLMEETKQNYVNFSAAQKKIEKVEAQFAPEMNAIANTLREETGGNTKLSLDFVKAYHVDNELPGWQSIVAGLRQEYGTDWKNGMGIKEFRQSGGTGGAGMAPGTNINAKYLGQYEKAKAKLKGNPTFINTVKAKDEAYKKMQTVDVGWRITENVEGKDMKLVNNNFRSIVETAKSLNPSSTKGNLSKFIEIANPANKNFEGNLYTSTIDSKNQTATLYVSNDKDGSEQVTVPLSVYNNVFPGRVPISQFRQKFQSQIELSGGRTTDWQFPQGGFATAYDATSSDKAPYIVKYHIDVEGANNYILKYWVKDRVTGKMEKAAEPLNGTAGIPLNMTESEVMTAIGLIKDPNFIQGIILRNQK